MANGNGTYQKLNEKAQKHWVVTMASTFVVFVAALSGVGSVTGWYDAGHTSQEELNAAKTELIELINDNALSIQNNDDRAFCANLALRISILEQQIWQLNQTEPNGARIVEKKRDLDNLEQQFRTKNCANILRR